jgi:probable phosphoglycerate mutase
VVTTSPVRLLLIRHGRIDSNVLGRLDAAPPGPPLDSTGLAQAAALAERLADWRIDSLACSPLTRTRQTAKPLATARGLTVAVLEGLREIACGIWEGSTNPADAQAYYQCLVSWRQADQSQPIPGGEDRTGFLKRFDAAVDQILATLPHNHSQPSPRPPDQGGGASANQPNTNKQTAQDAQLVRSADLPTAAIVTHGAAIRAWVGIKTQHQVMEFSQPGALANAGLAIVVGGPSLGWDLMSWEGTDV